jgi:hypothetical protein
LIGKAYLRDLEDYRRLAERPMQNATPITASVDGGPPSSEPYNGRQSA